MPAAVRIANFAMTVPQIDTRQAEVAGSGMIIRLEAEKRQG
jgi:hypothetical protein